jgi:hypothetical protein
MKPKIKILFLVILGASLFFSQQKIIIKIWLKSKSDKSTGEVNFRKAQLFF